VKEGTEAGFLKKQGNKPLKHALKMSHTGKNRKKNMGKTTTHCNKKKKKKPKPQQTGEDSNTRVGSQRGSLGTCNCKMKHGGGTGTVRGKW